MNSENAKGDYDVSNNTSLKCIEKTLPLGQIFMACNFKPKSIRMWNYVYYGYDDRVTGWEIQEVGHPMTFDLKDVEIESIGDEGAGA